jgi:hypothetical protein
MSRAHFVVAVALITSCGNSGPPEPKAGCNPLIGDDCMTPYPSSFFQADSGQVAIPDNVLPVPHGSAVLSASRLNTHDGVSPATPFVVYFTDGVDPTQLPTADMLDQSVMPTSTIQVIDWASGARVPVFAELDSNALTGDRQALIIRPMVRLQPATRYVIALVGLNDASGKPLAPAPFVALRDKTALNDALKPLESRYEDIFDNLEGAGVPRAQLTLAWDVTTASDADSTGHLVAMRDQALTMVDQLTWTITKQTDTPTDPLRTREIVGTFDVPSFLTDDTLTGTLIEDATGAPMLRGSFGTANFVVDIPACAATAGGPIPVVVFGHGIFGAAQTELETGYERQVGNFLCMVQIGTDWIGLSQADTPTLAGTVFPDFNQLHIITDRLQQAHVNAQVLTRLVLTRMKDDPALALGGVPVIDGSAAYYFGISNGGIQGGTFMALSEDITRGALNVPGGNWSLLMFRSMDFSELLALLGVILPDKLDEQILVTLMQPEFDFTDPAGFAPHVLADPLPGSAVKQVLLQEGIGDEQVTNLATRLLARTMGVPGLDLEQPVYGVTTQAAPMPSAYTQWDSTPSSLPPTGDSPATQDNMVHDNTRKLGNVEAQIKAFLAPGGMVTDVCGGAPCICNFAGGTCDVPPGV